MIHDSEPEHNRPQATMNSQREEQAASEGTCDASRDSHASDSHTISSSLATSQFLARLLSKHGLQDIQIIHDNARCVVRSSSNSPSRLRPWQEKNESRWASCSSNGSLLPDQDHPKTGIATANVTNTRHVMRKQWSDFQKNGGFDSEPYSNSPPDLMESSHSSVSESSDVCLGLSSSSRIEAPIRSSLRKKVHRGSRTGPLKVPMRRASIEDDDELVRRAVVAAADLGEDDDESDAESMDADLDSAVGTAKLPLPSRLGPLAKPVRKSSKEGSMPAPQLVDTMPAIARKLDYSQAPISKALRNSWPSLGAIPKRKPKRKSVPFSGTSRKSIASEIDRILGDLGKPHGITVRQDRANEESLQSVALFEHESCTSNKVGHLPARRVASNRSW